MTAEATLPLSTNTSCCPEKNRLMTFTNEQLIKARSAKSADELLAMAKESGISMTEEQAAKYFAELNKQGELSDDELTSVAGGGKDDPEVTKTECYLFTCPFCGASVSVNITFYDDKSKRQDIYSCSCGAEIGNVYISTANVSFYKNGQDTIVYGRKSR